MKKMKFSGLILIALFSICQAQDIDQAKKAIDAEKYEEAKSILKNILKTSPSDGITSFFLGNVYLIQNVKDSAKIHFENGLSAKEKGHFNHIGLGQIDLDKNDIPAATEKFALATKDMRKKDYEEYIYVAKAYMNNLNPDYKTAITVLNKGFINNPQEDQILLTLGDAYYGDGNQNEAYRSYRDAFQINNTLLKAKVQLGVLLKGAKSYEEAIKAFNEVIMLNPNYGPVYRELAETYYKIARNRPSRATENYKTALGYYQKYMSLTDYSIHSRMRYADFLILVKDYKKLEEEANKMIELKNVNPRIYRYLGYSAYENGNIDTAIKSLETFTSNTTNKIIAKDYQYLGMAKIKSGISPDGLSINPTVFQDGLVFIKKAIEMEPLLAEDLHELGKKLYSQKLYKETAAILEFGASNRDAKSHLDDNIYFGLALYYANNKKEVTPNPEDLQKADAAFDKVLTANPKYSEAYLYKARTNSLLENDPLTIKNYEEYLTSVSAKGAEEMAKPAVMKKIIESYNTLGAIYATTDKTKAIEYFNKTLALDATNAYAVDSIEKLK